MLSLIHVNLAKVKRLTKVPWTQEFKNSLTSLGICLCEIKRGKETDQISCQATCLQQPGSAFPAGGLSRVLTSQNQCS